MFRKCIVFLLLLCLITTVFPACAGSLSKVDQYSAAQTELKRYLDGDNTVPLDNIRAIFKQLGTYKKSSAFNYYTAILIKVEHGEFEDLTLYASFLRLDSDFCVLLADDGYPSVDELEAYALGRQAEAEGDANAAIAYYQKSMAVLDSLTRAVQLRLTAATSAPTQAPTTTPTPAATARKASTPTPARIGKAFSTVVGDYEIYVSTNGTCKIMTYTGNAINLNIPNELEGYPVTEISPYAINDNSRIITVTIPENMAVIPSFTFASCMSLCRITVSPDNRHYRIENDALIDSSNTLVCHPAGLNITRYTIPESVTAIGERAFQYHFGLQSIEFHDRITSIGAGAFWNCNALTSIEIPASVTTINSFPFAVCIGLSDINVAADNPQYYAENNMLIDKDGVLLNYACGSDETQLTIPDTVMMVGMLAFSCCDNLVSITVPDSVFYIDNRAFEYCDSLETLTLPRSVISIDSRCFDGCDKLTLRVPTDSYAHQYAIDNGIPYTTY